MVLISGRRHCKEVKPDLTVCNKTDKFSKTSVCLITTPLSTVDANAFCIKNGMTLYKILDAAGYNDFVAFYKANFKVNTFIIANGFRFNFTVPWTLYDNQAISFYSGVTWSGPITSSSQACVAFGSSASSSFFAKAIDCAANPMSFLIENIFLCQY